MKDQPDYCIFFFIIYNYIIIIAKYFKIILDKMHNIYYNLNVKEIALQLLGGVILKNLNFSYLLDFYKNILPEKQYKALDLYYNEDLSLAEIADEFGITRQGVRDSIKRGEAELLKLEEKLMLMKKLNDIEKCVLKIKTQVNDNNIEKAKDEIDKTLIEIYK